MTNWIEHGLNQCSLFLLLSIVLSLCILLQQQGTMGMAIVVPVVALVAASALPVVQNPQTTGEMKLEDGGRDDLSCSFFFEDVHTLCFGLCRCYPFMNHDACVQQNGDLFRARSF